MTYFHWEVFYLTIFFYLNLQKFLYKNKQYFPRYSALKFVAVLGSLQVKPFGVRIPNPKLFFQFLFLVDTFSLLFFNSSILNQLKHIVHNLKLNFQKNMALIKQKTEEWSAVN